MNESKLNLAQAQTKQNEENLRALQARENEEKLNTEVIELKLENKIKPIKAIKQLFNLNYF